eukprot:TRINITY_DN38014_c0_g1_i1.p1 TRINITY_DN38014_c0_g1~~TRINITY_DN38014_c0_g1_i1.p1  ORF type:complete len:409 (-),score=69.46 TRINITY_DN38014_c0_g1_i1:376-1521(-)
MTILVPSAYRLLGLQHDADDAEIKKAYKTLALQWHPDKHPPEDRPQAEERFKAIGCAYELLRDEKTRCLNILQRPGSAAGGRSQRPPASARPRSAGAAFCRRTCAPSAGQATSTTTRDWSESMKAAAARAASPGGRAGERRSSCSKRVMPRCRIEFARGSACVGRAYRGEEAPELSKSRKASLHAVAGLLRERQCCSLEVQGSSVRGELREKDLRALASGRAKRAVQFLVEKCGVDAERCRLAPSWGEHVQGIELRLLRRLRGGAAIDASHVFEENAADFAQASRQHLGARAVLQGVAGEWLAVRRELASSAPQQLLVEVALAKDARLAELRAAVVREELLIFLRLISASEPTVSTCARLSAAGEDTVSFFAYDELPLNDA